MYINNIPFIGHGVLNFYFCLLKYVPFNVTIPNARTKTLNSRHVTYKTNGASSHYHWHSINPA
jgi:hypothetical protein